ncbi:hypothetical protein RMATCC62417_14648 [Rhizopus microsporus]|nr:hypothetical protein RMATCC62417_14648 [Rhizopus microsporus]
MKMDGKSTGEDGVTDSSDRRSSATRTLPTERCEPGTQKGSRKWDNVCPLLQQGFQDLLWWKQWIIQKNGLPIQTLPMNLQQIDLVIHVDASDNGWGVHSSLIQTSGFWTPAERGLSINVRELKTILFALQMHGPSARGWGIKMYTDNITALKYVTKSEGTASLFLQDLAIQIQETINKYNMTIHF